MITVEQIQYILELSKTHSFHKTAENLYVSQPAISKAIKKAEEELKLKLFDRSSSGVYPTKAGMEMIKVIDDVLRRLNDMYLLANYFSYYQQEEQVQSIQLYSHNTIGNYVLPQIVTGLHSYIHDMDLQVIELSLEESLDKISKNDQGIGMGIFSHGFSTQLEQQNFRVTKLCQVEPHMVVNKDMVPLDLDIGESISLKKLSEYPLVLNQFVPPLSTYLLDKMAQCGSAPKIILRCPTASIFTQYITDGLACGIIAKLGHFFLFPPALKNIVYFPVESDEQFDFLLYSNERFPVQLYQLFQYLLHRQLMLS